jgi:hypothetical protein
VGGRRVRRVCRFLDQSAYHAGSGEGADLPMLAVGCVAAQAGESGVRVPSGRLVERKSMPREFTTKSVPVISITCLSCQGSTGIKAYL